MRIKRWLAALAIGAILAGAGLFYGLQWLIANVAAMQPIGELLTMGFLSPLWRILLPLLAGALIIVVALTRLGKNLVEPFRRPGDSIAASLYDYSRRSRGPHIVAIGGGTGLPSLLRGLKTYTSNITAIVTVADDGGSSGRLREEFGMLPPGDFRNNIAALSRDEALMTQLLQYRFGAGLGPLGAIGQETASNGETNKGHLRGHAFGNLLLAALVGVTGSFDEALLAAERVLAMRGRVLPSTLELVTLVADVQTGEQQTTMQRVAGESAITKAGGRIKRIYLEPPNVRAYPAAVQAILQAELVVVGPGSLFTSIMPNLLVRDVANALKHTRAPVVYICNLATQPGETDNFTVGDHVDAILENAGADCLDFVIANDNLTLPKDEPGHTILVQPHWPSHLKEKAKLIVTDLVDEARPWRHDSEKLASAVRRVMSESERGR